MKTIVENKMSDPFNLIKYIKQNAEVTFTGIDSSTFEFIKDHFSTIESNEIFVYESMEKAKLAFENSNHSDKLFFPGLGSNPYSSIIPSESLLNQRFQVLNTLSKSSQNKTRIYTSFEAILLKLPPKSYFQKEDFKITVADIISPEDLKSKLIDMGYGHTPSVEEEGTFASKGEIFDIFPYNHGPIRIHYFDDMIEEIFEIDQETLKTNRDRPIECISFSGSALEIINPKSILNLRNNLYKPNIGQKEKINYRNEIFHKLSNSYFFDRYPIFVSSFFDSFSLLNEHIQNGRFFFFNLEDSKASFLNYLKSLDEDFTTEKEDSLSPLVSPDVDSIYARDILIQNKVSISELDYSISAQDQSAKFSFESIKNFITSHSSTSLTDQFKIKDELFKLIRTDFSEEGKIYIIYKNDNARAEFDYFLDSHSIHSQLGDRLNFLRGQLDHGFYSRDHKVLVLCYNDIFPKKIVKLESSKRKESKDVFADQLSTLKVGDFVIHKNFGVGKYIGIDQLDTNGSDFLCIEYENQDKVYVPVYKMDLIQKHAEGTSFVKVANLNSKKFEQIKAKARSSVKQLAFDLLKLQAQRNSQRGFEFSAPDASFHDFEKDFPYQETIDQLYAIEDTLKDMQGSKPMDRLVCGDVGFGKTEVAMRASYKAVLDAKQVAVLVPTTVLAFQHYNSFVKRFKNFPVNIEYISRFKSTKEITEILKNLKEGKVDILIGTHKLLSEKIVYRDLGLLIIDEEQRFGVSHKEKLKVLKSSVDCLTLTATPIPRTLQLSFLGIKDLSIIKSAPPNRQSIKTYVIREDPNTIRAAIKKELSRGGQIFIVHNRVQDIENYASYIKNLTPEAKIVVAHGQLAERELEKRIKLFYEQKYDILVSTTIIESGIDIPSANTLIIDRADQYGLSQLHQLRGRIGRSDKKAYAYFITPHDKNLSDIARKRLKAIQTYADLGSGFSLATNDLEIRGSGDILGAEQSGHIAEIGLELYMELLKDAIKELKGEPLVAKRDVEIITGFKASIPINYISDAGNRLKFYKRLSNANTTETVDDIISELSDIYGEPPVELINLANLLKSKIILSYLPLKSIKVGSTLITLKFDETELQQNEKMRDQIIQVFMSRPKVYKLSPNFSVQCKFKDEISVESFGEFCDYIASQIDA